VVRYSDTIYTSVGGEKQNAMKGTSVRTGNTSCLPLGWTLVPLCIRLDWHLANVYWTRCSYLLNKEIKGLKLPFSIPFGQNFSRKVDFGGLPVTSVKTVQFTGGCYTLRERSVVILQYYNPVAKKL